MTLLGKPPSKGGLVEPWQVIKHNLGTVIAGIKVEVLVLIAIEENYRAFRSELCRLRLRIPLSYLQLPLSLECPIETLIKRFWKEPQSCSAVRLGLVHP